MNLSSLVDSFFSLPPSFRPPFLSVRSGIHLYLANHDPIDNADERRTPSPSSQSPALSSQSRQTGHSPVERLPTRAPPTRSCPTRRRLITSRRQHSAPDKPALCYSPHPSLSIAHASSSLCPRVLSFFLPQQPASGVATVFVCQSQSFSGRPDRPRTRLQHPPKSPAPPAPPAVSHTTPPALAPSTASARGNTRSPHASTLARSHHRRVTPRTPDCGARFPTDAVTTGCLTRLCLASPGRVKESHLIVSE